MVIKKHNMMKTNRFYNSIKLCLALITVQYSGQLHAVITDMDVNQLIQLAVDKHPLVLSADAEAMATQEGVTAAKLGKLPTPSISSSYDKDGLRAVFSLEQPIWTAGTLDANIHQAENDHKAAQAFIDEQQIEVAKRTINAWQSFIAANNLQHVYQQNLKELDRFESMMQRRVRSGVSARIELDLITNRILQAQNELQGAREQQRIAVARLEQIAGDNISDGVMAAHYPLDALATMARAKGNEFERLAFDEASITNPTVIKNAFQVASAKAAAQVKEAQRWPQLYATYQHEYQHDPNVNDDKLVLGFKYSPGAGFSSLALTRASQARVRSLEQSQEAARRMVMEDLQTEFQQYASAKDKERAVMAAVEGAKIVLNSYERQFIAGRKSWLDVLNTVRELVQYRAELVQIRSNLIASYYRLEVDLTRQDWQQQIRWQADIAQQPQTNKEQIDSWLYTIRENFQHRE